MEASSTIFDQPGPLPRGPHRLSRDEVASSQRSRLLAAFTNTLAERGYALATIGEVARRARVSRAAFYEHFADKQACLFVAYEQYVAVLLENMTAELDEDSGWERFIEKTLYGYLETLQADPVAARAFVVEMDAAGPAARQRRREAYLLFAELLAQRHAAMRARDPSLGPLPERGYLLVVHGVRELVRDRLETEPSPDLVELAPDVRRLITAAVQGAASAAGPPATA